MTENATPILTSRKACVNILGTNTDVQQFDDAIVRLLTYAQDHDRQRYVVFIAVYTIMLSREDSVFREIVRHACMRPADGMPVVWLQHRRGYPAAERVYAPDVMEAVCERSQTMPEISHYFYGSAPQTSDRLIPVLRQRYPGLNIAGYHAPPIAPLETEPDPAVIDRINATNPSIVWVSLGTGKQERWIDLYLPHLNAPLLLAVGAAFDFISGAKPQAPHWIQQMGMEWSYRLLTEPRRLARRYLVYNPLFILQAVFEQWRYWLANDQNDRT